METTLQFALVKRGAFFLAFENVPGKFKRTPARSMKVPDKFGNYSGGSGDIPVNKVSPGGVPVRGRSPQPQFRKVASGVAPRSLQQVRRTVPVRMVVRKPAATSGGRAVSDIGLGIIPPVKKVSGSKLSVFKNAFGGVRDRFEDVLDKFDGVGNVFDSVKEKLEGVQGVMGFLVVHWWVILVVLGVIGILAFSGFVGISSLKQECTFYLSVDCLDHSVKKDSVEFLIKNVAERNIIVKNIKIRSDALEGPSGSDSGICELALDQRGRDLKKNQKYLFQLDVRPAVSLSAATPQSGGNDWNLLAESVTLARAQGYNDPDLRATLASVSCSANSSVSDYLDRFSRGDTLRDPLEYYMGIVADSVANDPNPELDPNAVSRASTRADQRAADIIDAVDNVHHDLIYEVSQNIDSGSVDNYQNVLNAVKSAPDHFDSDSLQREYASEVESNSRGSNSEHIVRNSRSSADAIIAEVTTNLNGITTVARTEANRDFSVEILKKFARTKADFYRGSDSYFAVDFFVNKTFEGADTLDKIRSNANTIFNIHMHRPNQNLNAPNANVNGHLFTYSLIISRYYRVVYYPLWESYKTPSGERLRRPSSYSDYIEHFNVTDFNDEGHRNMSPVVNHYHRLIRDRVIPAYTTELQDVENSALTGKRQISAAFNDPYYAREDTPDSPLEDSDLNERHPEANDLLKTQLYNRFSRVVDSVIGRTGAIEASRSVHRKIIHELDNPPNGDGVKNAAKKEADRYEYATSGPAADFVIQRIENIVDSDPKIVVTGIEAAVTEAIDAVTEGANYVVTQASNANSGINPEQLENHVKSYARREYPQSNTGHHAAIFIANSDISGTDVASVLGKVTRSGDKIINAVKLAVRNVSKAVVDKQSGCSSGCSRYCYDANCQFEDYALEFPRRCDGQCVDAGGSCSDNTECCSGSCEGGSCVDPVASYCGSEGVPCCNGNLCNGNLVCSSGTCQAVVVCDSVGDSCCGDGSCGSGLVCGSSGLCEVTEVCDSVGDSCCGDGSCGSGLVCKSGTCETPCGAEHQQCCTGGDPCTGDLVCAGSGTASTCQQCGSGGQVCCGNRVCDENFECTGTGTGMCMGDCGSEGQKCCTGGSECGLNLACAGSGEDKTCQLCGEKDLACCTAGDQCRESNLECDAGICVEAEECGSESQACCAADTCGSGLECESGICREVECGSEGQVCCAASTCASGFECRRGTCRGAEECGSEGLMCCRGDKCDLDLECVNNRCEMPDVSDEIDSAFQTFSFDIITPGSNTSLVVNESGIPFSLIQFAVSEAVNDVELNVTSWSEPPPGVSGGPVGVQPYSYVTIASGDLRNEDVSPVVVEFSVAKDFFSEGVSPDYVRLFEYNKVSHAWNKLDDPAYLSEDEDSHYFKVVADGLVGDFAIGLEKFVSCAHRDIAEGKNRYTIELIYSWESSPAVNHKVAGELLANSPE